jgi:hypothetical protein
MSESMHPRGSPGVILSGGARPLRRRSKYMAEEERARLRVVVLSQEEHHRDVADMTPGERLGLMWQLALDAWAFQGDSDDAESGLQRHVVRVRRRGG